MDMKNVKVISISGGESSINFMDGLALLLIGLKLTDHLDTWTWVEVLSPLWAPLMVSWFLTLIRKTFLNTENEEE